MKSASARAEDAGARSEALTRDIRRLGRWLARQRGTPPLAVVLGGSVNGLSFARSLGRRGVPVLMLDSDRPLGMFTRYARTVLLPPADEHPEAWVEALHGIGARLAGRGVLFPTADVLCLMVARHRDSLERHFRFLVPDLDVVERIVDKRQQYTIAREAGIPIPAVRFPESVEEARGLAAAVDYPCLLKPYRSEALRRTRRAKVIVVESAAELVATYARVAGEDGIPLMIQDIVPGDDRALVSYLAYWDAAGDERAWLTRQKLRQYPPLYGDGSLHLTTDAPAVAELSRRLLRGFGYRGFVAVEFKLDPRDGIHRLIEINPRSVGSNQVAITAGVDLPWIAYADLTGAASGPGPRPVARLDLKCVNEEWDLQAYLALRRTGALDLPTWLRSLRGATPIIAAWDDPLPLVAGLWRFLNRRRG